MIKKERQMVKPRVGMMSCVGVSGEPPYSWGNYFSLARGPRVVNMWAENLEAIVKEKGLEEIEVLEFTHSEVEREDVVVKQEGGVSVELVPERLCFVVDERIPQEYLYEGVCVTGFGGLSREMYEALLDHAGMSKAGRICGCEKPSEGVHISYSFLGSIPEGYAQCNCHNCGRKWIVVKGDT
jgi:hypothetical protein